MDPRIVIKDLHRAGVNCAGRPVSRLSIGLWAVGIGCGISTALELAGLWKAVAMWTTR